MWEMDRVGAASGLGRRACAGERGVGSTFCRPWYSAGTSGAQAGTAGFPDTRESRGWISQERTNCGRMQSVWCCNPHSPVRGDPPAHLTAEWTEKWPGRPVSPPSPGRPERRAGGPAISPESDCEPRDSPGPRSRAAPPCLASWSGSAPGRGPPTMASVFQPRCLPPLVCRRAVPRRPQPLTHILTPLHLP